MTERQAEFEALETILNWTEEETMAAVDQWVEGLATLVEPTTDGNRKKLRPLVEEVNALGLIARAWADLAPRSEQEKRNLYQLLLNDIHCIQCGVRWFDQANLPRMVASWNMLRWANMQPEIFVAIERSEGEIETKVLSPGGVTMLASAARGLWPIMNKQATLERCPRPVASDVLDLLDNPAGTCGRWFVRGGTGRKVRENCGHCSDNVQQALKRSEKRRAKQAAERAAELAAGTNV
jgi:hypothetical protein